MPIVNTYSNLSAISDDDEFLAWDTSVGVAVNIRVADLLSTLRNRMPANPNAITVASVDAPANVKASAQYVCDGTSDQVQIQAALDANQWDAGNAFPVVNLTAGRYYFTNSVQLYRGQALIGQGWGSTVIEAASSFGGYLIESATNSANMITIARMYLDCNSRNVGGIHLTAWNASFTNPIQSGSDSCHQILEVYVHTSGTSGAPRHGIWLDGSGGSQNNRGNRISNCRIRASLGHGVYLQDSSDNFVSGTSVNTNRNGEGLAGFRIAGGSNKFSQCKASFADQEGFLIESSRAVLTGCSSQDSGGWGYNIQSTDALLEGCTADSNNRLTNGDAGVRIAGSDFRFTGNSVDRNTTYGDRQDYGFRYVSGSNIRIDASCSGNVIGDQVGTWANAGTRKIEILGAAGRFVSESAAV